MENLMDDNDDVLDRPDIHVYSINITLLHGTWGQGFLKNDTESHTSNSKRWFSSNSEFSNNLINNLKERGIVCRVTSTLWSGSNSIVARDEAAAILAQHLNSQHKEHPNTKQIVVAHSHGGNVALRATNYIEFTENINLITIATPFIQIRRRPISIWLDMAFFVFCLASMVVCAFFCNYVFSLYSTKNRNIRHAKDRIDCYHRYIYVHISHHNCQGNGPCRAI
jgi:hypothetical protein